MTAMPTLNKIVDIRCPPDAVDESGQPRGVDGVVRREVPCSIEPVSGQESETGGQQQAITSYRVELYGDPNKPIRHRDYLTLGPRQFNVEHIADPSLNQLGKLTLICGERHK